MLISHSVLCLLYDPNQATYENMKYGSKGIWKYVSLILIKNGNLTTMSIMLEDLYLLWVGSSLLHHIYAYKPQIYCKPTTFEWVTDMGAQSINFQTHRDGL
jgi:hypothetical protein